VSLAKTMPYSAGENPDSVRRGQEGEISKLPVGKADDGDHAARGGSPHVLRRIFVVSSTGWNVPRRPATTRPVPWDPYTKAAAPFRKDRQAVRPPRREAKVGWPFAFGILATADGCGAKAGGTDGVLRADKGAVRAGHGGLTSRRCCGSWRYAAGPLSASRPDPC